MLAVDCWGMTMMVVKISAVTFRAFAGYHMRKRLSREMPDLGAAVLEDALAIGGGILITALVALG